MENDQYRSITNWECDYLPQSIDNRSDNLEITAGMINQNCLQIVRIYSVIRLTKILLDIKEEWLNDGFR